MPEIPMIETPLLRMPKLGLGTWPLKGAEGQAAVESAIGLGYRHIDTAEMYGNEEEVGAGIAASGVPRGELFVTTKVWWDKLRSGDAIRAACEASIRRLGLDHLDLYLIHWPGPEMDLPAALRAMARIREDGLARAVGVSNFPLGLLRRAVESGIAPIACLQVEYHVYLSQARLLEYTQARGIALTAYSPTAKAAVQEDPTLRRIAAKHGATPVQVALAWLLQQDLVAAIPKAARPENQRANLAVVSLRLDAEDLAAIAGLPKNRRLVNPDFAPDWAA